MRARPRGLALLTPIVKAWCSDRGVETASTGIQVHGGMGFVEDSGAAQVLRDSRIAPIYEGTNGIQAIDLLVRKVARDNGAAMRALLAEVAQSPGLEDAAAGLARATDQMLGAAGAGPGHGAVAGRRPISMPAAGRSAPGCWRAPLPPRRTACRSPPSSARACCRARRRG
jgi:hypothetical protein